MKGHSGDREAPEKLESKTCEHMGLWLVLLHLTNVIPFDCKAPHLVTSCWKYDILSKILTWLRKEGAGWMCWVLFKRRTVLPDLNLEVRLADNRKVLIFCFYYKNAWYITTRKMKAFFDVKNKKNSPMLFQTDASMQRNRWQEQDTCVTAPTQFWNIKNLKQFLIFMQFSVTTRRESQCCQKRDSYNSE